MYSNIKHSYFEVGKGSRHTHNEYLRCWIHRPAKVTMLFILVPLTNVSGIFICRISLIGKAVVLKTTVGSDALAGSSPVCGALLFYHARPQILLDWTCDVIEEFWGIEQMVSSQDFDSCGGGSNPSTPVWTLSSVGRAADGRSARRWFDSGRVRVCI